MSKTVKAIPRGMTIVLNREGHSVQAEADLEFDFTQAEFDQIEAQLPGVLGTKVLRDSRELAAIAAETVVKKGLTKGPPSSNDTL